MGLASVFLEGCKESDFRQNFDIDTVAALPENERGREYLDAPKLDLDGARKFLESVDESFFPIKLSEIIKIVEVQNQPIFSVDIAVVKSVVQNFLTKQKAGGKLVNLEGSQAFLHLEFKIGEKVYQLNMPSFSQILVESNGTTKSLMLDEFRAVQISPHVDETPAGGVNPMIDLLHLGDKQLLRNVNSKIHSEFKDNAMDVFDSSSLAEFMKMNQNAALYEPQDSIFPHRLLTGLDLATWIDMIKQMPKDSPEAYVGFYRNFIKYRRLDRQSSDEYRHPIDSLKSGWADCDDFVILNALWAKLNGYSGRVVLVDCEGPSSLHVFVEIKKGRNYYVIDNDRVVANKTAEQYIASYPEYTMKNSSFDTF